MLQGGVHLRILIIGILASLTLLQPSSAGASGLFKSINGNFVVLPPSKMTERPVGYKDVNGMKLELHTFSSKTQNAAYIVSYSDFPADYVENNDPEKIFDGGVNAALAGANAKLIAEERITLGIYPGIAFSGSLIFGDSYPGIIRCRVYLVGRRLYQIAVLAVVGVEPADRIDAFLGSFALIK